ncbi:hypothetical protein C8K36_103475 [Rhodococcus sp. OK519]|uniref:hypothetical protein n=1 Tax=Rhodococcus sp. OK519 TaxID=2135729 RepID=UPI000D4F3E6A|nr:hypothetical protein C8K36_103475 [Rhodococcus sp. OK519]
MTTPDPFLRMPNASLNLPSDLTGDERLHAAFEAVYDYMNLHAMAWPARNASGNLVPPPPEHVLHELAHSYELADEVDLMVNPRLGTVAFLSSLPKCDFCGVTARYDAQIQIGDRSGGAYLCDDHYREFGSGALGATGDTYLMLISEVPDEVREICNQICADRGRDPIS